MVLDVIRQSFAAIQPFLEFGMRDVAGDNNGAGQRNRRLDRILAERLADIVHWLVEVYLDDIALEFTWVDSACIGRVGFQTLNNAVLGDLGEALAVGGQDTPMPTGRDAPWRDDDNRHRGNNIAIN